MRRKNKALLTKADDYKMFFYLKTTIKKQKSVIIDLISWLTGGPGDWEIQ